MLLKVEESVSERVTSLLSKKNIGFITTVSTDPTIPGDEDMTTISTGRDENGTPSNVCHTATNVPGRTPMGDTTKCASFVGTQDFSGTVTPKGNIFVEAIGPGYLMRNIWATRTEDGPNLVIRDTIGLGIHYLAR